MSESVAQPMTPNRALDELRREAFNTAFLMQNDLDFDEEMTNRIVDAVLSAPVEVLAAAMGGEVRSEHRVYVNEPRTVIVLPTRGDEHE